MRLKKAPSCTDGRDICLSRMLVSKSRAAWRRAEKAWRRREHNRAAMRCDATRQTKAATPSLLLRAVALAYACYGSAVRARPPTPGSRVYSRARASTARATRSPCWRQHSGARRCRGPRCHSISHLPLPPFALQPHARDLAGDGQIFSTGTEAPVVYLQNNRVFFLFI